MPTARQSVRALTMGVRAYVACVRALTMAVNASEATKLQSLSVSHFASAA